MHLEELRYPIDDLRGVGPAAKADLAKLGITRVRDFLLHAPRSYEDRTMVANIGQAIATHAEKRWVNTLATVCSHEHFGNGPRKTLKIVIEDGTGHASLICFNRDFLEHSLSIGKTVLVCGFAEYRFAELQLTAFEVAAPSQEPKFRRILPLYPLAGKLQQGFFRNAMLHALSNYTPGLNDFLPTGLCLKHSFPDRKQALTMLHVPQTMLETDTATKRMVYEELFLLQIQLARATIDRKGPLAFKTGSADEHAIQEGIQSFPKRLSELSRRLIQSLPFALTSGQIAAVMEIYSDFDAPYTMSRLLQGDVGCGKTLVALIAACEAMSRGYQAVIMVPTVLLARQHAQRAATLLEPLGITVAMVAGAMSSSSRSPLHDAIAGGTAQLIIGTHGLFSPAMRYHKLGLVIIDEQHRFGVSQRQALYEKASHPHLLMMSATPIPQTLALTSFGDMDISTVTTMPGGRLPVETHLARMGNEQKVYDWIHKELKKGRQAYFVYPLVAENGEATDAARELKSAESMAESLSRLFPDYKVALIHARLSDEHKEAVMHSFTSGETAILVATSVVEVGVDVPNASCMVVEHAERFGLASLHQLRGRVGRGNVQSFCFFVYTEPLSEDGKERILALKATNDGFALAEKDLAIRGPGDMKGFQQSGFIRLRFAHVIRDLDIMHQARSDAIEILSTDPTLALPEHQELHGLLEIIRRDEDAGTR